METKHKLALPVQIGVGEHGFNANILYDANGESLAMLYGIPQSTTINELRQLSLEHPDMWSDGLRKADFIMRACNSHDQLVAALEDAEFRIRGNLSLQKCDEEFIARETAVIRAALKAAEGK
jgi:hypothetical protein